MSFPDHLAAQAPGIGTDVDEIVGRAHDVLIVLHHNHRVPQVAEGFEDVDEAVGVARVKPDGGLVEDVEAAHERTAQRGGEVDALTFTARKRIAQAVEREVGQSHLLEKAQAGADFGEQTRGHLCLVGREGEGVKPRREFAHGTTHQFGDGRTSHPHIEGFGAQSGTVARGAVGLATIAREHDAVLDFVLIFFEHMEERVDADIALAVGPRHPLSAMPEEVALL